MYRVQGTMRENYYAPDQEQDAMPRRSNLEAPRVTVGNKRMTNIQLPGGEVVQGIRTNKDLGYDGAPEAAFEAPMPLKPLRYNPGLKCDPALEAMRPERSPKHKSISAGDKRIPQPQMPAMEPMPAMAEPIMMAPAPQGPPMMVPGPYMAPMNPYEAPYPSDLLSQIKMRNRRFQQSCAMEGMAGAPGMMAPPMMMRGPMMAPPPQMMMMAPQPQMTEDMMMMGGMTDELSMIEQDLNMTRRATRPFVPSDDASYFELQKQVHELETMPQTAIRPPRFNADEFLAIEDLPAPKKAAPKPEPEPERPKPAVMRQVGIADQIAIRSYVLGKGAKSSE